jgi:hypothetical protein
MKNDIEFPESKGISIAVVPFDDGTGEPLWHAYLVNSLNKVLKNVFVNISAKGLVDGKEKITTNIRYFYDKIEPLSAQKIEPVLEESLQLDNTYWVSYFLEDKLFDKKFLLKANIVFEQPHATIPFVSEKGIQID